MREVLRWIDRHDGAPALEILAATRREAPATDLLAGIVATDTREQSGIWSTASGVLAAYRTQGAMASTNAPPLDSRRILRRGRTRSTSARRDADNASSPRSSSLSSATCATPSTNALASNGLDGPPTMLALDEVANIAPIPDLPAMVSEGAGQGLLVLACLQDLSQARAGGARRPTASSRCSGPRSCCRASPTPPP